MNKIELAKAFGLECYSHRSDKQLEESIRYNDWYEVIFEINEKFFTISQSDVEEETVEDYWETASNIVIDRILNFITMDKEFREYAY